MEDANGKVPLIMLATAVMDFMICGYDGAETARWTVDGTQPSLAVEVDSHTALVCLPACSQRHAQQPSPQTRNSPSVVKPDREMTRP